MSIFIVECAAEVQPMAEEHMPMPSTVQRTENTRIINYSTHQVDSPRRNGRLLGSEALLRGPDPFFK